MIAKRIFDDGSGLIATPQPDDLWGWAKQHSQIRKVRILCHKNKSVVSGVLLECAVIGFSESQQARLT